MNGARAIEPATSLIASAMSVRRMKPLLAVADGQVCHCRSSGLTVWPSPMSDFGDQDVDGRQLRNRLRRRRRRVGAPGEIGCDAAGAERDHQDDNACGIHTLYYLLLHTSPVGLR